MPSEKTYLGKVVDNKDPLYQGRARINVFGIHDGISVEDLPWADQVSGLSFGGNYGGGNISIPRIGTIVSVHFEYNNYYKMNYQFVKEFSPDLLGELREENSYEGSHSIIYDSEAKPGGLKLFYTRKKGLVFSLGDATIQIDTQNSGDPQNLRVVLKIKNDEIRMENSGGSQKVIIKSDNIELGDSAIEKIILGDSFMSLFNSHTHSTSSGDTGIPTQTMTTDSHLSKISKTK
jgi:hypothetical protein